MGKFSALFAVFGFILALGVASASSYNLEFNQVDGKLIVKESIILNKTSSFFVELPEDYEDLYVAGSFDVSANTLNFQDSSASFVYSTSKGINNAKEGFYFVKKIVYPESFDSVLIRLNLDKGVVINDNEAYPTDYSIESDGETISLIWNIDSVKKGADTPIFVSLEDISEGTNWWLVSAVFLVIIVGFVFGFYYKQLFGAGKGKYKHLLDAEKKVVDELKKADRNELWQRQLQTLTGFSKAKLSRLVRNLESRGLIKKVPYGNTNKISLK